MEGVVVRGITFIVLRGGKKRKFSSRRASRLHCVILLVEAGWRHNRTMGRKKIMQWELDQLAEYSAGQRRREFGVDFMFRRQNHDEISVPLRGVYETLEYQSVLYISVSVHHKSIIYNKPTRCNSGSIVFINNYKYALHVSDALCVHLQEHYKP